MTKGDKIRLRAELAGRGMQGILSDIHVYQGFLRGGIEKYGPDISQGNLLAAEAVAIADSIMAKFGLSLDKED